MVTEKTPSSQNKLDDFLEALEEARKMQNDWIQHGIDFVHLYIEDVDGDWLEKWGEDDDLEVCSATTPVNLGQWMQHIFEAGWQAIADVLNPQQQANLALGFRNASVGRAKLIHLGTQPDSQIVALRVTLKPEDDEKIALDVAVYPTGKKIYLPENLKLILLSPSGEVLDEYPASREKESLDVSLSGKPGEVFRVKISLGDLSIAEEFVI